MHQGAQSSSDSEFSSEEEDGEIGDDASLASSGTSASRDVDGMLRPGAGKPRAAGDFHRELRQTLARAFEERHTEDIAALELNTLRMAYDADYSEIRRELMRFVLDEVDAKRHGGLKEVVARWAGLMRRVVHSPADQLETVHVLQVRRGSRVRHQPSMSGLGGLLCVAVASAAFRRRSASTLRAGRGGRGYHRPLVVREPFHSHRRPLAGKCMCGPGGVCPLRRG